MNDYALTLGYPFLVILFYGVWIALVLRIKRKLRSPAAGAIPPDGVPDLTWGEWAWLCGREQRACEAAATWLLQHGYAAYDRKERKLVLLQVPGTDCEPVYRALAACIGDNGNWTVDDLRRHCREMFGGIGARMAEIGLAVPPRRRKILRAFGVLQYIICAVPVALAMLSGVFLFASGFRRDGGLEPNMNPMFGTVVAFGGGLVFWSLLQVGAISSSCHLTAAGVRAVRDCRMASCPNRGIFQSYEPPPGTEANLALAVALFGPLTLTKTPLAEFAAGLSPANCD